MKLPWDKNYLKICFHIVFTASVIYLMSIILDNWIPILDWTASGINTLLTVLSPLIIAIVIAYLLDPLVDFFQDKSETIFSGIKKRITKPKAKKKLKKNIPFKYRKRTSGTAITYIVILGALSLLITMLLNSIGGSAANSSDIINKIDLYIQGFNDFLISVQIKLAEYGVFEQVDTTINSVIVMVTEFLKNITTQAITYITKAGSGLLNFIIGATIAFYFLREKEGIIQGSKKIMKTLLPEKINNRVLAASEDVNIIFSGYIRGQLTDALIMSILISIVLTIIGVKFSVVIGIISGISNLIPYFGAIIAFVLAIIVSLFSGSPITALYAAIAIIVLQQIDGTFIVPKVVGEKVELHPAVVLLSLSVAGALFGVVGMVLAVPIVAIIKLFLVRFVKRLERKKSL